MILDLVIDGLPSCNSADAPSWRVRRAERKAWKAKVCGAVLLELGRWPTPLPRAHVTLTRCSSAQPDSDNLASSWKFILDGLKLAQVIVDDSPACIGKIDSRWEMATPKKGCVRIRVEAVDAGIEIGERVMASLDRTGGVGA